MRRETRSYPRASAVLALITMFGAACGGSNQAAESQGEAGAGASRAAKSAATVPAGTPLTVSLDQQLDTKNNSAGDAFTATVTEPVTAGSQVAIPQGAKLHGQVTAVQKSGSAGKPAVIKVDFQQIEIDGRKQPIQASVTQASPETKSRSSTGEKAAKIGAGAAAGAIVGRIIGGDAKGTLIGAAVGAAAGTAITLGTEDVDAVLPAGSTMRLRTDAPLQVQVAS